MGWVAIQYFGSYSNFRVAPFLRLKTNDIDSLTGSGADLGNAANLLI